MNNDTGNVYVDLTMLADWANQINNLNDDALNILSGFQAEIDDLDNYFKGNFATGFINGSTKFVGKAKGVHNTMKGVPMMLKDIIKVKDAA
jgi:uncharacterized protein YukE